MANEITIKDAENWNVYMVSATKMKDGKKVRKYADAYISKRIKQAKQIFKHAVKHKLVTSNPFREMVAGKEVNPERQFFVTREMTVKMMAECQDAETRLLLGLYRFGGLRQQEAFKLRWVDVNFENGVFMVTSPKTKKKKPYRVVPIFPELRPLFEDAFEAAEDGADFVISYRPPTAAALYSKFAKIRKRAGVEAYPRLFHNLRATRQTELLDSKEFTLKNVCDWIGNDEATAMTHYLQTTDEQIRKATQVATGANPMLAPMLAPITDDVGACEQKKVTLTSPAKNRGNAKNAGKQAHKKSPQKRTEYTREDSNL